MVRLNYNHVMVLLDVAESGSINAAAERRHVAQSAVSRIMRELEVSLKVKLLQRHVWGVELTEAGQVVVNLARTMRAEASAARRDLALLREGAHATSLSVGANATIAAFVLPGVIKRLSERAPECRIMVREGLREELIPALAAGELDVIVCRIGDVELPPGLAGELIYRDSMAVLANQRCRSLTRGRPSQEELLAADWVLPPPDAEPYKDVIAAFESLGIPMPTPKIESSSIALIRTLLLSGQNWRALVPRDLFNVDIEGRHIKVLCPVPDSLQRSIGMIRRCRADIPQSAQLTLFAECLAEVAAASKRVSTSKSSNGAE